MKDTQSESLQTLQQDLTQLGTYLILTETIIHYIKTWIKNEKPTFQTKLIKNVKLHTVLHQDITEQCSIGWYHFIQGRITKT